jgi:putative hydrolase, CocE/NonD family
MTGPRALALALLLFRFAWCHGATASQAAGLPFDHSSLKGPIYASLEKRSEYVTMPDGTRIAVDLYLPRQGPPKERFPTIFQYTPYQRASINPETGEVKDLRTSGLAPFFTGHGYAVVVADMRGTGASTGWLMDFMPEIGADGRHLIDWIAAQPWSDGKVGMSGGSYLGWAQTATAAQRPAALKCIAPAVVPLEGYTGQVYPGGIFLQGFIKRWSEFVYLRRRNTFDPGQGDYPTAPVVDEDGDGELKDEIPLDRNGNGSFLDEGFPPRYRDGKPRQHLYYLATKEHHERNYDYAAWSRAVRFIDVPSPLGYTAFQLGPNAHIGAIMRSGLPIYHFGGWFDGFARGTFELYATLEGQNPQKLAMFPAYHPLIRGPFWEHFGHDPNSVKQLLLNEHLRFLDRYLKGIPNGIEREPPLTLYVMNGEGWRFEREWPLKRQVLTRYYLDAQGRLSTERLGEGSDTYRADLGHDSSYGKNGGNRWLAMAGSPPDQLPWRTQKDPQALVYQTEVLIQAIEVTGHPIAHLALSSSADYGDFFVYLEDVDAENRVLLVTEGQLRAEYALLFDNDAIVSKHNRHIDVKPELPWHGYERRHYRNQPLANGEVLELVIDLQPTSWVFRPGHRIRVAIAAADHPTFELHPRLSPANDPKNPRNIVPTITVHRRAGHASYIELPVIPKEPLAAGAFTPAPHEFLMVGSRGAITHRPSLLDPDVRLSPHPAPDVLNFRFCIIRVVGNGQNGLGCP